MTTKTATKTATAKKPGNAPATVAANMIAGEPRETRMVALADLYLHKLNPRKSVTPEEIDALAASLETVGLLQNLLGYADPDQAGTGVVAGGRRLRALQQIAKREKLDPTGITVPVKIANDRAEAEIWAGAENAARMALHPAVEVDAYHRMTETGATTQSIAKAFAVTEKHVLERLKLATLAKPVLTALSKDQITVDQASAFTLAPSKKAQADALPDVLRYDHSARDIRHSFTRQAVEEGQGVGAIITRAEYEAEGGASREDMFTETVFFEDGKAVQAALTKKLQTMGAEIKGEGWRWIEVRSSGFTEAYELRNHFDRIYPEQVEISEAEEATYNELAAAIEAESATKEQEQAFDALEAKMAEEAYTADQMKVSGVVVALTYGDRVLIERGLIRKEDKKVAAETGVIDTPSASGDGDTKPKPDYSQALNDDLAAIRTLAVQHALLNDPALAVDLLGFAMSDECDGCNFPIQLRPSVAANRPTVLEGLTADPRLIERQGGVWPSAATLAKRFSAYRAKSQEDRNATVTIAVARVLQGGLKNTKRAPIFEGIATEIGASVRAVWTPTEAFFNRLPVRVLDKVWCELHARKDAASFTGKKPAKVGYLHALFNDPKMIEQQTAEVQARVAAWLPTNMDVMPKKAEGKSKAAAKKKAVAKKKA